MTTLVAPLRVQVPIEYPERDGKPMAETDTHIEVLIAIRYMLRERYRDDPNVYEIGRAHV